MNDEVLKAIASELYIDVKYVRAVAKDKETIAEYMDKCDMTEEEAILNIALNKYSPKE